MKLGTARRVPWPASLLFPTKRQSACMGGSSSKQPGAAAPPFPKGGLAPGVRTALSRWQSQAVVFPIAAKQLEMLHQRVNYRDRVPGKRGCRARCPPRRGAERPSPAARIIFMLVSQSHGWELAPPVLRDPPARAGHLPCVAAAVVSAPPPRLGKHVPALPCSQPGAFPGRRHFEAMAAPSTELWGRDSAHPLDCHVKSSPQPAPPGGGRGDEAKPQEQHLVSQRFCLRRISQPRRRANTAHVGWCSSLPGKSSLN